MTLHLSPYALVGERLVQRGFSAIPIAPGSKAPGFYSQQKGWRAMFSWSRYCDRLPTTYIEIPFWCNWPDAGIGVAATHGINFADIDTINAKIIDVIKAILPPSPAIKTGQKGETLFYRADFPARHFDINGERVLDWLGHGTRTVLPPSIHPDICAPYRWTGFRHLPDLSPDELPIVTQNTMDELVAALERLGYHPEPERAPLNGEYRDDADSPFRALNNAALAKLDAWVPKLGLRRVKRVCNGYRAVAWWRPSYRGRPLGERGLNLKIHKNGIRDFHEPRSYTPIDLVMEARGLGNDNQQAFMLLSDWLGRVPDSDFIQSDRKAESVAKIDINFDFDALYSRAALDFRFTASELQTMIFPPIKYVVPGYIVEGCTLLAGAPKLGKSWFALEAGIAVAEGGSCLGSVECEQGNVLYLALEDNGRRLQSRMRKLMARGVSWPPALEFRTKCPRSNAGGIVQIREWRIQ